MTTTTTTEAVALICSECGIGNYRRSALTDRVQCENCAHRIYAGDIDLEAGETLTWTAGPFGALAYLPAPDLSTGWKCFNCGELVDDENGECYGHEDTALDGEPRFHTR